MSIAATKWVWAQQNLAPSTRYVLLAIADFINQKGDAWPSMNHIAEKCELSQRMVRRHISAASKLGLITILQTPGKTSTYRLLAPDTDDLMTNRVPRTLVTGGADTGDLPHPYVNRKGTVTAAARENWKKLSLKILEALIDLGQVPTSRTPTFTNKFSKQYPDIPLEWIDKAKSEIEQNDVENIWPYMKAMLTQWHDLGGPQNGFTPSRVRQTKSTSGRVPQRGSSVGTRAPRKGDASIALD